MPTTATVGNASSIANAGDRRVEARECSAPRACHCASAARVPDSARTARHAPRSEERQPAERHHDQRRRNALLRVCRLEPQEHREARRRGHQQPPPRPAARATGTAVARARPARGDRGGAPGSPASRPSASAFRTTSRNADSESTTTAAMRAISVLPPSASRSRRFAWTSRSSSSSRRSSCRLTASTKNDRIGWALSPLSSGPSARVPRPSFRAPRGRSAARRRTRARPLAAPASPSDAAGPSSSSASCRRRRRSRRARRARLPRVPRRHSASSTRNSSDPKTAARPVFPRRRNMPGSLTQVPRSPGVLAARPSPIELARGMASEIRVACGRCWPPWPTRR